MIITFLGTSSGTPSSKRNVSAISLWFTQRGKWWLFDCGEGTQHQVMRSPLTLHQLERIFITHLHGDHLYGLIGLLASRSLRGGSLTPLTLYGPPGIEQYVQGIMSVSPVHLQYPLEIKVVQAGRVFEDEEYYVEACDVMHRVPALAYAVVEKERPGVFRADLAKAAGIPSGPLYGRLKSAETITLEDGRVFHGKDFVGLPQKGLKIAFSGDTVPCAEMVELARGADVLIHEATYMHPHLELAQRAAHSTALQAAEVAKAASVEHLLLTHFSPRYEDEEGEFTLAALLAEAESVFPKTILAADFLRFEVKRKRGDGDETHHI